MKSNKKKYYTLKQVSKISGLPIHTLKYWRKEFKINLQENSAGRKIFAQDDIDQILMIKHLRFVEKLTLKGIKRRLHEMKPQTKSNKMNQNKQNLILIQKELLALKNLLQLNCRSE